MIHIHDLELNKEYRLRNTRSGNLFIGSYIYDTKIKRKVLRGEDQNGVIHDLNLKRLYQWEEVDYE